MSGSIVSLTHLTMGKLFLRSLSESQRAAMGNSIAQIPVSHWTLRLPSGCVIVDVHPDESTWQQAFATSDAMFRDPVHRFWTEAFTHLDDDHEVRALELLERARTVVADRPPGAGPVGTPGLLQGRLVSFNRLPRMPRPTLDEVFAELASHAFSSLLRIALTTPAGPLLIEPYLDEATLIDDFVVVRDVVRAHGYEVVNEWYPFVDRTHERALDLLAYGLGRIDHVPA